MTTIAVIPARGGSKGIRKKNIVEFKGSPLLSHTVVQAEASAIDHVFVSTDDSEIAAVGRAAGASIINRPDELSGDEATTESALLHALDSLAAEGISPDTLVLLQCTSPLRSSADINNTLSLVTESGFDSALSCCEDHKFYWRDADDHAEPINYEPTERKRRQEMEKRYQENGSIYVARREILETEACRIGGKVGIYQMPKSLSFEIDTPEDMRIVSAIADETDAAYTLADPDKDYGPSYSLSS